MTGSRVGELALKDDRLKSGRTGIRWRPAWRFPKETEAFLADLLRAAPRPILHVCAGASRLGDVRVDLFHPAADVKADAYRLPFKTGSAGTVIIDPPFPVDATTLQDRLEMYQEFGRVVRVGGLVILHAPFLPRPSWGEIEAVYYREAGGHAFPQAPVLVSVVRRDRAYAGVAA